MKKHEILLKIIQSPNISSSELASFFEVSRVAIYYHIKQLLEQKKIYSTGNRRSTRYFPLQYKINFISNDFYNNVKAEIIEEYEGFEDINIENLLNDLLSYLTANNEWKYGIEAFYEKIYKENNLKQPKEELLQKRLLDFICMFLDQEQKRRRNGFFNGTQSLNYIMESYDMPSQIDTLLFTQVATLSKFGRLRGANEIYWGKKDQNEKLLQSGIERGTNTIVKYIKKRKIKYCIYTPPTVKRVVQFRGILKKNLEAKNVGLTNISCEKRKNSEQTLRPQKDTRGLDRIINARSSMRLQNMSEYLHTPEIIIFDDNFTTGATVNAIAEMMRQQNYTGKITAITLTGNFEYIPGVTDEGDI